MPALRGNHCSVPPQAFAGCWATLPVSPAELPPCRAGLLQLPCCTDPPLPPSQQHDQTQRRRRQASRSLALGAAALGTPERASGGL